MILFKFLTKCNSFRFLSQLHADKDLRFGVFVVYGCLYE